jgi:hypothetical protein
MAPETRDALHQELLEKDPLYGELSDRKRWFSKEADKHKTLHRSLWVVSSVLSILIALGTTFDTTLGVVGTAQLAAGLAIVLPAVTAYMVLRSPEQLWIMEIHARNRLGDLATRMKLAYHDDPDFDRTSIRGEYFEVMKEANERWVAIKQSQ